MDSDSETSEENPPESDGLRNRTRSGRASKPPNRHGDYSQLSFLTTETAFGSFLEGTEEVASSAKEALSGDRSIEWSKSMFEELNSLVENGVFSVVEKQKNRKDISNR